MSLRLFSILLRPRIPKYLLIAIVIFSLVAVGLLVFEKLYQNYLAQNWSILSNGYEQTEIKNIQTRFDEYQYATLASVENISRDSSFINLLQYYKDIPRSIFFEYLLKNKTPEMNKELYDQSKQIIAWDGTRGISTDTACLINERNSFIKEGAIYTYFNVSIPINNGEKIVGYVVAKKYFDVNYPINNRFINSNTFSSTFISRFSEIQSYKFHDLSTIQVKNDQISAPLLNLSGKSLGIVLLSKPTLSVKMNEIHDRIIMLIMILVLCFGCIFVFFTMKKLFKISHVITKILVSTIILWCLRYLLIWLDIPQTIIHLGIFDPTDFASRFGYGISRSLGDLLLTSIFLFTNIFILVKIFVSYNHEFNKILSIQSVTRKILLLVSVIGITITFLVFTRGFAAFIISAVYDSTISYTNLGTLIPSIQYLIMLISIMLVTLSFLIGEIILILMLNRVVSYSKVIQRYKINPWMIVTLDLLVGSYLYGIIQENPLLDQLTRISMVILLIGISLLVLLWHREKIQLTRISLAWILFTIAVILIVPQINKSARELERNKIEIIAADISKPIDSWLTYLLNNALEELLDEKVKNILQYGDEYEKAKLAFTKWAGSLLGKEGYNCTISYYDQSGMLFSQFSVGLPSGNTKSATQIDIITKRNVRTEERNQDGLTNTWYIGDAPIHAENGRLLGSVHVELTGNRKTIITSETPEILHSYANDRNEYYNKSISYLEFVDSKLVSSSRDDIPKDKLVPSEVNDNLLNANGKWCNDIINGKLYEAYFFKDQKSQIPGDWLALYIPSLDTSWYLNVYLRYILIYSSLASGILFLYWIIQLRRTKSPKINFKSKLLIAITLVSIIPLAMIAYFNREFISERVIDSTIKNLSSQTDIITSEIRRRFTINTPFALEQLTDNQCKEVADDLNTDFNIYSLSNIQATSKPEMFDAELLDPFLSSNASLNIIWKRKDFFQETQMIGNYSYVVGYRPFTAENGAVIGVVSVPTIYNNEGIEEELAQTNLYFLSAYSLSLLMSVIIGIILANRISSPIKRLKDATARIAKGELKVQLEPRGHDEIGDLESSFLIMTHDLKYAQEQMVKAQREAAWKEMAKQVAHEIKNPLTPIKLSVQHLQQAYKDKVKDIDNVFKQVTKTILDQIEVLNHIATEFSRFARMPERKLTEVDLHGVINDVALLFKEHDKIKLNTKLKADSFIIVADKEELQRAIINIVRNAVEAMKENGNIEIETRTIDSQIELMIKDNGSGITPETMARLFEPNFSTKTFGMGLGLSIVKKTIDELGGTISIMSEVGKGTTVLINLPLV